MKFKKHICVFVTLLVFLANIGYSFTVHYCNDTIASVSLNSNFEEPCKEPVVSCCAKDNIHDSCCSNKIIKVEKKHDNFINKSLNFESNSAILNTNASCIFSSKSQNFSTQKCPAFYCESNAPPIYKLNCQLVFYA